MQGKEKSQRLTVVVGLYKSIPRPTQYDIVLGQGAKCEHQKSLTTKDLHIFLEKGMLRIRNNLFPSGIEFDSLRVKGTVKNGGYVILRAAISKLRVLKSIWTSLTLSLHTVYNWTLSNTRRRCSPGAFLEQKKRLTREIGEQSGDGKGADDFLLGDELCCCCFLVTHLSLNIRRINSFYLATI